MMIQRSWCRTANSISQLEGKRFAHVGAHRYSGLILSCKEQKHRNLSSSSQFTNESQDGDVPFYGLPRPPSPKHEESSGAFGLGWRQRLNIAIDSATTALRNPARADAIATLGDATGHVALERMHRAMKQHPVGRQILAERPIVSKDSLPLDKLHFDPAQHGDGDSLTFGQAYGKFLQRHSFDPDDRDQVNPDLVPHPELAYIMLRYRQCHDYWHTLTGLPPTVLGELGLKWLELFQTGLPVAALSATAGSLRLKKRVHVETLFQLYVPWAIETHRRMQRKHQERGSSSPICHLMNVYYEKEFDTPLEELRDRLGIIAAPARLH